MEMADIDTVEKGVNFVTSGTDWTITGREFRLATFRALM
jgi:hypothetical protein